MVEEATVVVFGGGKVARTVLAPVLKKCGQIVFVEIRSEVAEFLNACRSYQVRLQPLDENGRVRTKKVSDFSCLDSGKEEDRVTELIADPNVRLVATAVGKDNLPDVARIVGQGLSIRKEKEIDPPVFLICENVVGSGEYFRGLIEKPFPGIIDPLCFPDTVIDCIVPEQDLGEVLDREEFCWIRIEKNGNEEVEELGRLPISNANLKIVGDIRDWHTRKFWTVNTPHLIIALFGIDRGLTTVQDVLKVSGIEPFLDRARKEIATATSLATGFSRKRIQRDLSRNFRRFGNPRLRDTNERVSGNLAKKLLSGERLVKPALVLLKKRRRLPTALSRAIALGIFIDQKEAVRKRPKTIVDAVCPLPEDAKRLRDDIIYWVTELVKPPWLSDNRYPSQVLLGNNS